MQKLSLLVLIIIAICYACNSNKNSPAYKESIRSNPPTAMSKPSAIKGMPAKSNSINSYSGINGNGIANIKNEHLKNRKIIWTSNLNLQVEDVEFSTQRITEICEQYDCFISEMNQKNYDSEIYNNIQIRIKNNHFQNVIDELKNLALFVKSININSDDVTEEFVDIERRLNTKKQARDRYINILKTKTGKVKDIIEAEEAIRRITEEIEAKEGRLRFLKDRVDFSTINVRVYQKVEFVKAPVIYIKPYTTKMAEAFLNGWAFISNMFLLLITIWPLLLLVAILSFWQKEKLKLWRTGFRKVKQ